MRVCFCTPLGCLWKICLSHISPNVLSYSFFHPPHLDRNSVFVLRQTPPSQTDKKKKSISYWSTVCASKKTNHTPTSRSQHNTQINSSINSLQPLCQACATVQLCPIFSFHFCLSVNTLRMQMQHSWVSKQPGVSFPESISESNIRCCSLFFSSFLLIQFYWAADTLRVKIYRARVNRKRKNEAGLNFSCRGWRGGNKLTEPLCVKRPDWNSKWK